ncbi:MAG: caspase family protein [bacterium]
MEIKKSTLIFFTFFILAHSYGQITVTADKVIPCAVLPNVIALSPDGNTLIAGGNSKKLRVFDTNSGKEIAVVVFKDVFSINDVQFAPDGKSFAAVGDYWLIVFDTKTFEAKYSFTDTHGVFNSISFSPDSKKLAVAYHYIARIWDLTTFESEVLSSGGKIFNHIVWSPSGTTIALSNESNNVAIWEIGKQKRLMASISDKSIINGISYGKNGSLLYSCSPLGDINILDVLSGEKMKQLTLTGHSPYFVLPAFSTGSLISGGEDGRLICWETDDYNPRTLIDYPKDRLLSCSISYTSKKIALGFYNKSVHILTVKNDDLHLIKQIVSTSTQRWQQQGKFEKSANYLKRVNDSTRIRQIDLFTQWAIDSLGQSGKTWAFNSTDYDADNEMFKLNFIDYPPITIDVPLSEAESFDQSRKILQFKNPKFTYGDEGYVLMHLDIANPANSKTYTFDKKEAVAFNPEKLELAFDPIVISIPKAEQGTAITEKPTAPAVFSKPSDVDQQIPSTSTSYPEAYALIIGNEDYTKYNSNLSPESNVPFARNDAKSFYNYALKVLGIPAENIFFFTDAIGSVMKREIEKVCKLANLKEGKTDLLFYYAGHGLPDEETKESYILPVDISTENLKEGIKLKDLYQKFSDSKARRTIVIVDACFSGEGRNQSLLAARAVRIKPQEATLTGNIVVMTAVKSDQRSLPYNQQQHGIFTYFLLKHLKETNGNATLGDLEQYLAEEVPISSLKLFGIEQSPQIFTGTAVDANWNAWTLKKSR